MLPKLGRKARIGKSQEGAAVLELALVLPIFILALFGIIDFGNLFFQMHKVSEAARAAARYATVQPPAAVATGVTNYVQTNYGNQFQVEVSPTTPVSKQNIKVTVTTSVPINTPIISSFFPSNPYTVTGTCVMGLEN